MTHTESNLRGNSPAERYNQAVAEAKANAAGKHRASAVMTQGTLLEALGPQVGQFSCLVALTLQDARSSHSYSRREAT